MRRNAMALFTSLFLIGLVSPATAKFAATDLQYWVGSGANEAVLVIDWIDPYDASQDISLAWGYRFDGAATGLDMMNAINAEDPRLDFDGGGSGFISHIGFDETLDGTDEYFHAGWDGTSYWSQWTDNGLPPFDGGDWAWGSGVGSHNLVDGSWSGWRFADGTPTPREPQAVSVIPEPASSLLFLFGGAGIAAIRRFRARRLAG
jgi:hypothetical protein